jgi:HTH-type transcriptional regulator / antitoxin HipB
MLRIARTPHQLGVLLRRERRARALTQAQLGEKVRLRQATISRLEKGEPATRLSTVLDVLTALGLQIEISERRGNTDG